MSQDPAEQLAARFAERYETWNLQIPAEDVQKRRPGHMQDRGWLIQYLWGEDASGVYLDYYAAHRMTDDRHVRLYADGRSESLPAIESIFLTSDDPAEARRLADEHARRNREVAAMLAAKGFTKFGVNAFLRLGLMDEDAEDS